MKGIPKAIRAFLTLLEMRGTNMEQMKTAQDLDLGKHEVGYKWRAGETPPGDPAPGEWLVRRDSDRWVVLFHSINGPEYAIHKFSPTMDGERTAKNMALKLVEVNWARQGATP